MGTSGRWQGNGGKGIQILNRVIDGFLTPASFRFQPTREYLLVKESFPCPHSSDLQRPIHYSWQIRGNAEWSHGFQRLLMTSQTDVSRLAKISGSICLTVHASSFSTTSPSTSVSRKSRPWKRYVNFV